MKKHFGWSDSQVYTFCKQLAELLQGGFPLLDSLRVIREQPLLPKHSIRKVELAIQNGRRLSEALRSEGFPLEATSFMEAAEDHGNYAWGCEQCAEVYQTKLSFHQELRQTTRYPIIVLLVVVFALLFLSQIVVPRFSELYLTLGVPVPWITKMIFPITVILCLFFAISLGAALFLVYGKKLWMRSPLLISFIFRIPFLNILLQMRYSHFFSLQLGALLQAGIPIVRSLEILQKLTPWSSLRQNIQQIRLQLIHGNTFTSTLEHLPYPLFLSTMKSILLVSERTGELGKGLIQFAEITEKGLKRALEEFFQKAQPILTMFLGFLVGAVVLALFLPMFQLVQAL